MNISVNQDDLNRLCSSDFVYMTQEPIDPIFFIQDRNDNRYFVCRLIGLHASLTVNAGRGYYTPVSSKWPILGMRTENGPYPIPISDPLCPFRRRPEGLPVFS